MAIDLQEQTDISYSWNGIKIKKYLKNTYNFKQKYKLVWKENEEILATLMIDCSTDKDMDAPLFQ